MIEWIGIACVAWTATELLRMSTAAMQPVPTSPPNAAAKATHSERDHPDTSRGARRSKRFAAWDDRGRPIDVEDLGRAARSR